MAIFRLVTSVSFLIILAYVAWTIYQAYDTSVGNSKFQRLLAACRSSATILWNKFVIMVAAVTAQLDNLADFFNAPELKDFINAYFGNPKVVAAIMMIIASISIMARLRPSSKDKLQ